MYGYMGTKCKGSQPHLKISSGFTIQKREMRSHLSQMSRYFPQTLLYFTCVLPRELTSLSTVPSSGVSTREGIWSRDATAPANVPAKPIVRQSAMQSKASKEQAERQRLFLAPTLIFVELITSDRCSWSQFFWHAAPPFLLYQTSLPQGGIIKMCS